MVVSALVWCGVKAHTAKQHDSEATIHPSRFQDNAAKYSHAHHNWPWENAVFENRTFQRGRSVRGDEPEEHATEWELAVASYKSLRGRPARRLVEVAISSTKPLFQRGGNALVLGAARYHAALEQLAGGGTRTRGWPPTLPPPLSSPGERACPPTLASPGPSALGL